MAWENIEERLKQAFRIEVIHPKGVVWYPDNHLDIDEWLTSIAQTDEELQELNIPRIRFLQNRWPLERLLQLEWEGFTGRRLVLAMVVERRAYILFQDGFTFEVIGALEPKDQPELYDELIREAFEDPRLVPSVPKWIRNRRPDLISRSVLHTFEHHHEALPPYPSKREPVEGPHLRELLVDWLGVWTEWPVGYWYPEESESAEDFERHKVA